LALLLLCAAYVLPGLLGRDPWKTADVTAFGYMVNIATGKVSWWAPTVGGLPVDTAVAPHWLGALFIAALSPLIDPAIAARLAFCSLLVLSLALTWYSTFQLARRDGAQPLPFAFGGEANQTDYSRALADGAVLALIASLGLLQLGHETTPELVQLCAVALLMWSGAAAPFRPWRARLAVLFSLPLLAISGAPSMALGMGLWGTAMPSRGRHGTPSDDFRLWMAIATALSAVAAWLLGTWSVRWQLDFDIDQLRQLLRLFAWFLWPSSVLALWTLWRWRHHLAERHLAWPLGLVGVAAVSCIVMGGSDRALMLALPPLAVLAAFALPTLKRSAAAAIDWFTVFFFSACAATAWVLYAAVQTGLPAQPAANVARLVPGFKPVFSPIEFLLALAGTLAWLWLVRWRTGRHRHALWKSLVLPASGVALCWLLVMTLWLPVLDHARSYRPWVARLAPHVHSGECIAAPGMARAPLAALEYFGPYAVDGRPGSDGGRCAVLVLPDRATPPIGWRLVSRQRRPTERSEAIAIYRRAGDSAR
jgi:hypothetical protein